MEATATLCTISILMISWSGRPRNIFSKVSAGKAAEQTRRRHVTRVLGGEFDSWVVASEKKSGRPTTECFRNKIEVSSTGIVVRYRSGIVERTATHGCGQGSRQPEYSALFKI